MLDMGEQVRIVDMARRLVATVPRQVDIVYTGLRPGEKLYEDLLASGEQDERPFHPLIRHVPVAPMPPDAVTGLDPADSLAALRAALTDSRSHHSADIVTIVPTQAGHGSALTGSSRARPAGSAAG